MQRKNQYLEKAAVRLSRIKAHHHVLELGFGPGIGLSAAYKLVKEGEGKIYGVDHSSYVLKHAFTSFRKEIREGKVELYRSDVINLPFADNTFDRVFHCNCFYFWADLEGVAKEIHRVMKPNSLMVTTLSLSSLQQSKTQGHLPGTNTDVLNYMVALENASFSNVYIEYLKYKDIPYQAIFAEADKKLVDK
uniref:Methyltransferase type 11 domain-containing protein n=1 Tax=Strigamia maritima TaxID=126957 RepID=T1IVK0_STRMM